MHQKCHNLKRYSLDNDIDIDSPATSGLRYFSTRDSLLQSQKFHLKSVHGEHTTSALKNF